MTIDKDYLGQRMGNYRLESAEYRKYRQQEWRDNHQLYYTRTDTNDTTQRQKVCATIMKSSVNTILSQMSDSPDIYFDEIKPSTKIIDGKEYLDNKNEIKINAYWKEWSKEQSIKLKDTAGKKNAGLYGRDIKGFDIENGNIIIRVVSPANWLVTRGSSVYDEQDGGYKARTNIKKTINEIAADERYDKDTVKEIMASCQVSCFYVSGLV